MSFRIDKCRIVAVMKGKLEQSPEMQLSHNIVIPAMNTEPYKYLCLRQTNKIDQDSTKREKFD